MNPYRQQPKALALRCAVCEAHVDEPAGYLADLATERLGLRRTARHDDLNDRVLGEPVLKRGPSADGRGFRPASENLVFAHDFVAQQALDHLADARGLSETNATADLNVEDPRLALRVVREQNHG